MGTSQTTTRSQGHQMVRLGRSGIGGGGRHRDSNQNHANHRQAPWPLTCAGAALKTRAGWLAIGFSVVITLALIYCGGPLLAQFEPVGMVIEAVTVRTTTADRPELLVAVRAEVMVSGNCTRQTFYSLVRPNTVPPSVYPLGQTIAGKGFSPPWRGAYDIQLSVPSGIPAGQYGLTMRAVSDCEWLGLLTSRITTEDRGWRVMLP